MSVNSHSIYQYTVHTLIMTDKYIKLEKKTYMHVHIRCICLFCMPSKKYKSAADDELVQNVILR